MEEFYKLDNLGVGRVDFIFMEDLNWKSRSFILVEGEVDMKSSMFGVARLHEPRMVM